MACQHETPQHRSALEFEIHHETAAGLQLVRHDPTANAPERDHDVDAPELDLTSAISQVAFTHELQVAYHECLPEAVATASDKEERTLPDESTSTICGLQRKKFWILFCIVVSVVVAVAVGTSVGIEDRVSSTPQPSNTPLTVHHTIFNNSSLAAVTLSNGDRRLFFQDASGAIRDSLYSISSRQWATNVSNIVATDARNDTPLAAIKFPDPSDQTFLFYIALNNSVTLQPSAPHSWVQASKGISGFVVANDTRLLFAALSSLDEGTPGDFYATLVFQDASGQARRLELYGRENSWTFDPDFPKKNLTFNTNDCCKLQITSVSHDQAVLNPPILAFTQTFPDNLDVAQVVLSTRASRTFDSYLLTINGTAFESLCHVNGDTNISNANVVQPDLASSPISPFPFTRLAATSLTNGSTSSAFCVYHQINDTTFAEDIYDTLKGVWTSTNFTTPVT